MDYWSPEPAVALALLAAQTTVLLTLAVLLSMAISPMASGVVAVGLFCTTWVAGVVGGVGASLGNDAVARVGTGGGLLPAQGPLIWPWRPVTSQEPCRRRAPASATQGHRGPGAAAERAGPLVALPAGQVDGRSPRWTRLLLPPGPPS